MNWSTTLKMYHKIGIHTSLYNKLGRTLCLMHVKVTARLEILLQVIGLRQYN
jgi:hypothetical protein